MRLHIHWFKTYANTGLNKYQKCRCGMKRVKCAWQGYQPIDWDLLK